MRDILTVNQDAAAGKIVEAGDQVDDRSFARTCRSDKGDAFACPDIEGDILQDVQARIIGEGDVVEGDLAPDRQQFIRSRYIAYRNRFIQRFEDTLQIGDSINEVVVQVREIQDRLPETGCVGAHGENDAEGDILRTQREQAYQKDQCCNDRRQVVDRERDQCIKAQGPHPFCPEIAGQTGEDAFIALFP
ncbi:hypothetical protein D3C75_491450 [compost metagenome]